MRVLSSFFRAVFAPSIAMKKSSSYIGGNYSLSTAMLDCMKDFVGRACKLNLVFASVFDSLSRVIMNRSILTGRCQSLPVRAVDDINMCVCWKPCLICYCEGVILLHGRV